MSSNAIICAKFWQIVVNYFQRRKQPPTLSSFACRVARAVAAYVAAAPPREPGRARSRAADGRKGTASLSISLVVLVQLQFLTRPLFRPIRLYMSSPVSQSLFHAQLEALYCGWPRDAVQPCYGKLNGMALIRRFYSMCRYQRLKV